MAYEIRFFDEVLTDVVEAKRWYKDQRDGLEMNFAMAVEQALEQIKKMPTAYSIRYKTVRITHTKVFPYNIHFYIDEKNEQIVVTAIVHNKRHPSIANKRV